MSNDVNMSYKNFFILIIGLLVLSAGAFYVGQKISDSSALKEYTHQFEMYQDTLVKPTLRKSDSLQVLIDSIQIKTDSLLIQTSKKSTEISSLRTKLSALHNTNVVLIDSIRSDTSIVDSLHIRAINGLELEVKNLNTVVQLQDVRDSLRQETIQNLTTGLTLATARGDSLYNVIINFPTPKKTPRKFGIPLPAISNSLIFISGLVSGILLTK